MPIGVTNVLFARRDMIAEHSYDQVMVEDVPCYSPHMARGSLVVSSEFEVFMIRSHLLDNPICLDKP